MHVMHTMLYSIHTVYNLTVCTYIFHLISEMIVSNDDDDKNYTFFEEVY